MDWFCGHCNWGPMRVGLDYYCVNCSIRRDAYSNPPPPSLDQSRQGGSTSYGTAGLGRSAGRADIGRALPMPERASQKSGFPVHAWHELTPEESHPPFLTVSEHAQGPWEHEVPSKKPVDETKHHREPDKGAIAGDEISISEDIYEQGAADDSLREGSGDTELSDDVELSHVLRPSSDPGSDLDSLCSESDLDSLDGPLIEVENGDCIPDISDTSEESRMTIRRGVLLPPLIYMLLLRICGIVARLLEPNPLPGRRRIRWTCQCGQMLYDDFIELRPGALADLEKSLNATEGSYECAPSSSRTSRHPSNARAHTSPGGWLGTIRWPWKTAKVRSSLIPLQEQRMALDRVSSQLPTSNESRGLCIFLCMPYRKTANRLHHWVVEETSTDESLFSTLRSLYQTASKGNFSFLSLKAIKSIRFVRFEVYSQKLVDVLTSPDMPDNRRSDQYSYRPVPAEFIPPIGENHMMHLYNHPEETEHTAVCLEKIPKKIEGLAWLPTHPGGSKIGWGLHFVEGLDIKKLSVWGFIGVMISITFGVAWFLVKGDLQSGFAVAACMLTGLIFTTGLIQAAYALK